MKKQITLFIITLLLGVVEIKAQSVIATLEHNGTSSVFYGSNTLVEAYDAAVDMDVIVLSSGYFNCPVIQKGIKIIGVGHYPDSVNKPTFLSDITLGLGANGVTIEGIKTNGIGNIETINVVTIRRCYISCCIWFNYNCNNITIESSVTKYINFQYNDNNVCIRNNLFITDAVFTLARIANGALIENNLFYLNNTNDNRQLFYGVSNSLIKNNVIYRNNWLAYSNTFDGCYGNNFQNNYFCFPRSELDSITNSQSNNYWGPITNLLPDSLTSFDYNRDYHILNSTQYLGTDGTQIGIYGGSHPYKERAIPSNPRIIYKNIATESDLNGNLQINIKAKAQNN